MGHKNLLNPTVIQHGCNCQIIVDWPLSNQCLTRNIYRTDFQCQANNDHKFYLGVAQTPCQERFWNNNWDFNQGQYIKSTELSQYIQNQIIYRTELFIFWLYSDFEELQLYAVYHMLILLLGQYHWWWLQTDTVLQWLQHNHTEYPIVYVILMLLEDWWFLCFVSFYYYFC